MSVAASLVFSRRESGEHTFKDTNLTEEFEKRHLGPLGGYKGLLGNQLTLVALDIIKISTSVEKFMSTSNYSHKLSFGVYMEHLNSILPTVSCLVEASYIDFSVFELFHQMR